MNAVAGVRGAAARLREPRRRRVGARSAAGGATPLGRLVDSGAGSTAGSRTRRGIRRRSSTGSSPSTTTRTTATSARSRGRTASGTLNYVFGGVDFSKTPRRNVSRRDFRSRWPRLASQARGSVRRARADAARNEVWMGARAKRGKDQPRSPRRGADPPPRAGVARARQQQRARGFASRWSWRARSKSRRDMTSAFGCSAAGARRSDRRPTLPTPRAGTTGAPPEGRAPARRGRHRSPPVPTGSRGPPPFGRSRALLGGREEAGGRNRLRLLERRLGRRQRLARPDRRDPDPRRVEDDYDDQDREQGGEDSVHGGVRDHRVMSSRLCAGGSTSPLSRASGSVSRWEKKPSVGSSEKTFCQLAVSGHRDVPRQRHGGHPRPLEPAGLDQNRGAKAERDDRQAADWRNRRAAKDC